MKKLIAWMVGIMVAGGAAIGVMASESGDDRSGKETPVYVEKNQDDAEENRQSESQTRHTGAKESVAPDAEEKEKAVTEGDDADDTGRHQDDSEELPSDDDGDDRRGMDDDADDRGSMDDDADDRGNLDDDAGEQAAKAETGERSKEKAVALALQAFPGTITDIDREEEGGTLYYEIDIVTKDRKEIETIVNAETGKVTVEETERFAGDDDDHERDDDGDDDENDDHDDDHDDDDEEDDN